MQKIWQEAEALQTELVERRRDLHRHPETGLGDVYKRQTGSGV